ncbi:MAG: 6-bladed beta-propeller [Prevotellaceae bacterium]|jgi:hypothetical protein|nr:6-bladed beta-propeller [Prevotellaceae bacterium]
MKRFIYIILVITLVACKKEQKKFDADEIIISTETSNENLLMSEYIDTSYFIQLETNDNSLIKMTGKIVFDSQRIFIYDLFGQGNNKLLVFDRNGKFLNTIGNFGNGPGEYAELRDFCIDSANRQIFLLCESGIVRCYDYAGRFKEKYTAESDLKTYKIECLDEHFYFIGGEKDFFNLVITDSKFKITQKFFPNKDFGENMVILVHPLNVVRSHIQYRRDMDNYIYLIKDHKDAIKQYAIDFGENTIDFSELKNLSQDALREKIKTTRGDIYSFIQNSGHAVFYYSDKKEVAIGIYDKKSRITKNYSIKNMVDKYLGNHPLFFEYVTASNEFVAVINPAELQEISTDYVKGMQVLEDDNPILYVVKMK